MCDESEGTRGGGVGKKVPVNKKLLTGTVHVNKELLTGTVPVNKELLTGTVPVNNLLQNKIFSKM